MANIITSLPRYSDGQIRDAFMREIKLGFHQERVTEGVRVRKTAEYAQSFKGSKEVPGLGRHIGAMPARDYMRLIAKYGHAEVHSDKFMQDFQKRFPHLASNKI